MEFIQELINKYMQSKDKSNIYIILLILVMLFFSFRLFKNLTRSSKEGENPIIGILTFKNKLIQRKFDSEVIWDEVESGVEIRNRDTIRTGDYSDALLTLVDKSKININENSMIYLDFSDSAIINFAYGSLSFVGTEGSGGGGGTNKEGEGGGILKELKITAGDKVLEVGNSSLNLEKSGKEDLKLQVTAGKAKIVSNGKETVLKENEVASMTHNGIEISEVTLFPSLPLDFQKFYSKTPKTPVNFEWSTSAGSENIFLEISKDSKFTNLIGKFPEKGNSLKVSLDPGSYYWRLTTFRKDKKNKEISNLRKFQIFSVSPPSIISPEDGKIFKFSAFAPLIEITWKKNELYKEYSFELSSDINFSDSIKKSLTSTNHITVDNLPAGKYFARVTAIPISDEITPETSTPISITLESTAIPDPPNLISPSNGQKIFKMNLEKGYTLFQWKDNPEIKEYNIQISSSKQFDKLIYDNKLSGNQIKPQIQVPLGTYFWRVSSLSKEGKNSEFSDISSFELKAIEKLEIISPNNKVSKKYNDESTVFQWKKVDAVPNFIFEISKDENFQNIYFSINTNIYQITYKFKEEGDFFWRVRLLSEDNIDISKSDTYSYSLLNIKDPIILYPNNNEKIDMSKSEELTFKWERDPKVYLYIIEINDSYGRSILKSTKTNNNYYIFKDINKLEEGSFSWNIQSIYKKDETEALSNKLISNFKIILSDKPVIPIAKSQKKFYVE